MHGTKKLRGKELLVKLLVCGFVLIAVWVQSAHVKAPLLNAHYFRQTQTATIARNYYREGIDLLHPKLDVFGAGEKEVLVLEFPFFQGIVAGFYHIFGAYDYVGRMTAILWGMIATSFLFKVIVRLTGNYFWALVSVIFYSFSPLNIFFNQAFMVESSVVALHLISLYILLKLLRERSLPFLSLFILVTSIAFVSKIIYSPILLGTIAVSWIIFENPFTLKEFLHIRSGQAWLPPPAGGFSLPPSRWLVKHMLFFIGIFMSIAILFFWQRYADVTNIANGHAYFTSGNSGQFLWNVGTIAERLSPSIWELRLHDILAGLSKPFIFAILLGIIISIINFQKVLSKYCLGLIVISGLYYLTFFRIQSHTYYLMPLITFLSIVSGYGITQTALLLSKIIKKKWLIYSVFTIFLCFFSVKSIVNAQPYFVIDSGMKNTLDTIGSHLPSKGPCVLVLPDYDWNSVYSYYLDRKLLYIGAKDLTSLHFKNWQKQGYEYVIIEGLPDVLARNDSAQALFSQLSLVFNEDRIAIYTL